MGEEREIPGHLHSQQANNSFGCNVTFHCRMTVRIAMEVAPSY